VAFTEIGPDTKPGRYTLKVTVNDNLAKVARSLSYDFEVVPPRLGFIRTRLHYPFGSEVPPDAPPVGVPGQVLVLSTGLVGFDLDKKKNPDVTFTWDIVDSSGKTTLAKPSTGNIKTAPPKANWDKPNTRAMFFNPIFLTLTRPGSYRVRLRATDNLSRESVSQEVELTIIDPRGAGR